MDTNNTRSRPRPVGLCLLALVLLGLAACHEPETLEPSTAPEPVGEPLIRETTVGPVKATVSVAPAQPRLGDPVVLTLEVEAEPGVDVQLPAFGDQLGRFDILDFSPRAVPRSDGGTLASQRYTIDPPMSGKQRIPSLLVEFTDNRPNRESDEPEGELLTEELTLDVQSVLPEGGVGAELRPVRGPLGPLPDAEEQARTGWWIGGVVAAVLLALVAFVVWRRRGERPEPDPFDVAIRGLDELAARGFPRPDLVDAWYVALSDIIRRFIERRYGLRAPELTTEEFLRTAQESRDLQVSHRQLLRQLLERADRVKFAAYVPETAESEQALQAARTFVLESRSEATPAPQSA